MRDLTELNKLEEYLKEKEINYVREDRAGEYRYCKEVLDWHQIKVIEDNWVVWDVVCHYGSYGSERGMLEGSGEIFHGDVEGWLTAADVIRKIEIGGRDERGKDFN